MIRFLEGDVMDISEDGAVIFAAGIGYAVAPVGMQLLRDQHVRLWIHDLVREDRRELYGFESKDTLEVFEKLIEISGIGHKLAQKMLSTHKPEEIIRRIVAEDIAFLTSLPGIGKKTAQKIILELKGVLVQDEAPIQEVDTDVIDALVSLGYPKKDALDVLPALEGSSTEGKIRHALQLLSAS